MKFTKGDILLPSARVARKKWLDGLFHPAVVWEDMYEGTMDFRGIMLTHSAPNKRFSNVLMAANHFESGYKVVFENTHFANQVFMKFYEWGPFELVGKLTVEGVAFVESRLKSELLPMPFIEFYSQF